MNIDLLLVLVALFLVALNGFFVAAEFAIVKLRVTKAHELARSHGFTGRILRRVRDSLDAYLSACQLGITLASLGLGWIGEPAFARLIEPPLRSLGLASASVVHGVSFAVAFGIISFLHIVLGELAPKSIAIRKPEPTSLWTAMPLFAFHWIMYPFIYVLNGSAMLLLRAMGVDLAGEEDGAHSAAEIKQLLHSSHLHGELRRDSLNLLTRGMELQALSAGDLMRPDTEMVTLDADEDDAALWAKIRSHRYSRYPVYEGERDNVIGILHVKDLLAVSKPTEPFDLRALIKPALIVNRRTRAMSVLREFRQGAPHLAIVVTEYGVVEGFVTMDDMLETVVGRIQDEFRREKPDWQEVRPGVFEGSGSLPVYSLQRLLGTEVTSHAASSVGGLVIEQLERIPRRGDTVRFEDCEIEVAAMNDLAVGRVLVRRMKPARGGIA